LTALCRCSGGKSTISRHIDNVFSDELERAATVADFATVRPEGARQVTLQVTYYNLNIINSVGYRVKSLRGTQFRLWGLGALSRIRCSSSPSLKTLSMCREIVDLFRWNSSAIWSSDNQAVS